MGKLLDNMYDFADNVSQIPSGVVSGVSDIVGSGKDMVVSMFGIPPKFYNTILDGGKTIIETPQNLGNNLQKISENAKDISGNAKDTVDSLKPIMLIGIAIIAFKTISEFDSKEMGSNLTRAAMFA